MASWLNSAYAASKTRRPMAPAEENPLPPSMQIGGTAGSSGGATPGGYVMPSLGVGSSAPAPTISASQSATMPNLMPQPTTSATMQTGGTNRGFRPPPTAPTGPTSYTPTPPSAGNNLVPPSIAPPGPGSPGYLGPGPVHGNPGAGQPYRYDSPEKALEGIWRDIQTNPGGWTRFGLHNTTAPGGAGMSWLSYILADPYNRMISDAAEKQTLENTNTAFDAARSKMRADALQSGAAEGGVAQGASRGMELARGATQAKNVRDFEQYKVDTGDKRLQSLLMPYLAQQASLHGGSGGGAPQEDKTGQYLQYAALIASLFA